MITNGVMAGCKDTTSLHKVREAPIRHLRRPGQNVAHFQRASYRIILIFCAGLTASVTFMTGIIYESAF